MVDYLISDYSLIFYEAMLFCFCNRQPITVKYVTMAMAVKYVKYSHRLKKNVGKNILKNGDKNNPCLGLILQYYVTRNKILIYLNVDERSF